MWAQILRDRDRESNRESKKATLMNYVPLKNRNLSWRNSPGIVMLALRTAYPDLIPRTTYGSPSTPRVIYEPRAQSKPSVFPGLAPNTTCHKRNILGKDIVLQIICYTFGIQLNIEHGSDFRRIMQYIFSLLVISLLVITSMLKMLITWFIMACYSKMCIFQLSFLVGQR